MAGTLRTVIAGTGSYISPFVIKNEIFLRAVGKPTEERVFYGPTGDRVRYSEGAKSGAAKPTREIVANVEKITGIRERRWAPIGMVTSDISYHAAKAAIESSGADPMAIDMVIMAHNFGDQPEMGTHLDLVPSMAARIKNSFEITTPTPIASDIIIPPSRLDWFREIHETADGTHLFLGAEIASKSTDLAQVTAAAKTRLKALGKPKEDLAEIVVAHLDTGDGPVECIAERVKSRLGINKEAIAYDLVFGCPGWIQAMIEADRHLKAGRAKRVLVIGADTLSRVSEQTNMDCMIFGDGAGAAVCEAVESTANIGIRSYASRSDADKAYLLKMDPAYCPDARNGRLFITMNGHAVFKYAIKNVSNTITRSLELAGIDQRAVDKFLLHQANAKMDYAIYDRLCSRDDNSRDTRVPLTVSWLGNSSVATVPTMLDLISRRDSRIGSHRIGPGNTLVFASVGAGMNINSMVYQVP